VKARRDGVVVPETLRAPHEALKTSPDALTQAFIAANANLAADNMAISCYDGELVDVRICVAKSLTAFARCPKVAGHTCHAASITIAPLR
jgi:ribonuclease I